MEELEQEMAELAHNAQQLLYDDGVFTKAQLTQAVARLADVASKLCSGTVDNLRRDEARAEIERLRVELRHVQAERDTLSALAPLFHAGLPLR